MTRSIARNARGKSTTVLRYVAFAAMVAALVGIYTAVVGPSLGKLRLESTGKLLLPLMVISGVVALPIHAYLRRDSRWAIQILILYSGFVLTCLGYGGFIWISAPDGSPVFLITAVIAGHVLGTPLLLLLIALHLALERLGFFERER